MTHATRGCPPGPWHPGDPCDSTGGGALYFFNSLLEARGSFVARLTHWEGEPVSVWTDLWSVPVFEAHDELGSTSDRLKEIAGQGAGHFSVVISESQSAGRGRRCATWHSPAGCGLWMSVLLPAPSPSVVYLPLIVGLATARAVEQVAPAIEAGIEWPNDVTIGGKKVAGVLCEAVSDSSAASGEVVAAGIGVNVRTPSGGFAPDIASRAASLEESVEAPVSRAALSGAILGELKRVTGAEDPHSLPLPERVLAALNRRDAFSNQRVRTEQEGLGIARGILESGALLLERDDGSWVGVVAGSVRLE